MGITSPHFLPLPSLHPPLLSPFPLKSLAKMGITDEGINEIIAEVDKDGNGSIDYNEFCLMMRIL